MERTNKLLATIVPSIAAGFAVSVCGVSGCARSSHTTPTSEQKAVSPRETNTDYSQESVTNAMNDIWDKLPTSAENWMTRDDIAKSLPAIESTLLNKALDLLIDEDRITAINDNGTPRYYRSSGGS